MRRQHLWTVAAIAATTVALTAAPAWAAPTFTSGGEAEAGDPSHTVTMEVPDDEDVGATTEVRLTAPTGFVPANCLQPVGWSCTVTGQRVTWTRGDTLTQVVGTFGFQTAVPETPGTYRFLVRQTGTTGSVDWTATNGAPVVTVTGEAPPDDDSGTDDPPEESPSDPPASDDGPGTEDATDEDTTPTSASSPAPAASDRDDSAASDEQAASDDGGTTAPTRTEGRSSGTTLEISPSTTGAPATDAPAVAAPDVADAPGAGPATTTPVDVAAEPGAAGDGRGLPWQQVAGVALLAAGGLLVGLRRWRDRSRRAAAA